MTVTTDAASPTDRSSDRNRRAKLTSAANMIARVTTLLITLVTIPMTGRYLGGERFGLWMTISSFYTLLAFADLGMGNGLLTEVAFAMGNDDSTTIRRNISSALFMLTLVACLMMALATIAVHLIDWTILFGLHDPLAILEARPTLDVFVVCFGLGIPLSVVANSQLGLQMGFLSAAWHTVGSGVGLLCLLAAIHWHGSLPWLMIALLGPPLLASMANCVVFFLFTHTKWQPRIRDLSRASMQRLLQRGALYFVLQWTTALAYAADSAILARDRGAIAVGDYAITAKLFSASSIVVGILLHPLWPAYAEAMGRRDYPWVRGTLLRSSLQAVLLAAIISVAVMFLFADLTTFWIHRQVKASFSLQLGMAIWSAIDALGVSLAMFMNGAHIVRLQLIVAIIYSLTCFAVKLWLVEIYGAIALPWVTLVLYLPLVLFPILWNIEAWLPRQAIGK